MGKQPETRPTACLTCARQAEVCGLCRRCYQSAYRRMAARVVTRDELEKAGLILPLGAVHRKKSVWNQLCEQRLAH